MSGYGSGLYGFGVYGAGTVAQLNWSSPTKRLYEVGLDRGVLYPKDGEGVAWMGLTAVDENGADSGAEYYIDGRPFLHLQKPKEFTATLRAYTYPDEFSAIMGIAEAVDGVFLDSQMGDQFDLSYRTLIGDSVKGEKAGYKIHLIYNATVGQPGRSYATLTNEVNPIDLEWEIQAVPIPIPGFRPTAHVIIDSRHLDLNKLSELEAVLYGDGSTPASMPRPTDLIDLLSYGDEITIVDNGDGTWTATGARVNVYLIEDGNFQINNANAVDHGDGTYTIDSTV